MNQTEKNIFLLEKIKLLNPDHIPENRFVKPQISSPSRSGVFRLSLMAAGILSIIMICTLDRSICNQGATNVPTKQVFEILSSETMNPNQIWHNKQLVISINNGE